jgi:hypothetical protein
MPATLNVSYNATHSLTWFSVSATIPPIPAHKQNNIEAFC